MNQNKIRFKPEQNRKNTYGAFTEGWATKFCSWLSNLSRIHFTGLPQKLQNQIPGLSRTFLGHFPGLFKIFFLQVFKFSFDYCSLMHLLFCT